MKNILEFLLDFLNNKEKNFYINTSFKALFLTNKKNKKYFIILKDFIIMGGDKIFYKEF